MGMTNVNQSITASKRKLEGELGQLNSDLDEMTNEAKLSEDKAARAMGDAETRRFGDVTKNLRKSERSIKELSFAADEDRKAMIKMETRIRELESELDAETRRFGDVTKNLRKSERSYKKQIEEAEEIAALNLAKYRKVAGALGDAEASADANEQAMAMRKARAKSASLGL